MQAHWQELTRIGPCHALAGHHTLPALEVNEGQQARIEAIDDDTHGAVSVLEVRTHILDPPQAAVRRQHGEVRMMVLWQEQDDDARLDLQRVMEGDVVGLEGVAWEPHLRGQALQMLAGEA